MLCLSVARACASGGSKPQRDGVVTIPTQTADLAKKVVFVAGVVVEDCQEERHTRMLGVGENVLLRTELKNRETSGR